MTSAPRPPTILLTNDDGFDAPGLAALVRAVDGLGRTVVVAPDRERSGAGHALTLGRPLRVREVGPQSFKVDGTPTDCVHLGVFHLTGGAPPDLVISGVNRGLNVGDDVTYSGTVAGAMEGTLLHIPAIAVSAQYNDVTAPDFDIAARFTRRLAERILRDGLPSGVFLNVNVPLAPVRGVRATRQGSRTYRAAVLERLDPSGRPYFWIAGADTTPSGEPDGDHVAIADGFISVTPLHADLTHTPSLGLVSQWKLGVSD